MRQLHAANDPGCPVWLKRRGLLKDAEPTQRGLHWEDVMDTRPRETGEGSAKATQSEITTQDSDANSCESEEEMEYDA